MQNEERHLYMSFSQKANIQYMKLIEQPEFFIYSIGSLQNTRLCSVYSQTRLPNGT